MPGHPILAEFAASAQKHFACFVIAERGVREVAKMLEEDPPQAGAMVHFSELDPSKHRATAILSVDEVKELTAQNGHFSDTLAKGIIVSIYSEWDEYFRPRFAAAIGAEPKQVRCDLMGDVRHIRNCIIHNKSIVTNEHEKRKLLTWPHAQGFLQVDRSMLKEVIEHTHEFVVSVVD